MKKILVGFMVVVMGLMLMSPVVSAYPVSPGDLVTITKGIGGANNGGAFNISKGTGTLFDTFCLERDEYFSPGSTYYIGSITGNAIIGGIGGPEPDPISSQTAYLFSKWSSWSIAHSAANANALQLAIWKFEEEWTDTLSGKALEYWNEANDNNNGSLYGVSVLNIYGNNCVPGTTCNPLFQQDMLVGVPEPASMLLFGLGLLGLAGLRRKFKK